MNKKQNLTQMGWFARLRSTAKVAGSAAKLASRKVLGFEADETGALGEAIAQELDQMKGVAMKVGQILSYFDGVLPEQTHRALRQLQIGATTLKFATVAEVIEKAFNMPLSELFERFDSEPIAAASIGQVHRARFSGREVAVKIQYPGIRETMVGDITRLKAISRIASMATQVDGPTLVNELAERFRSECDYLLEAENQTFFRQIFKRESQVYIPEPFSERTRSNVLTTEWCDGRSLYELIKDSSQEDRNRVALVLVRFCLMSLFTHGIINADPHPGNYLFPEDSRVVFLDFGCVRRFDQAFLRRQLRLTQVVIENRKHEFRDALIDAEMVGQEKGFDFDLHWQTLRHQFAPYCASKFQFTTKFLRDGLEFSKPSNPNLRRLTISPEWIWVQRLIWGMHAVLVRLGAEANFADEFQNAIALKNDSVDADVPEKPMSLCNKTSISR